MANGVVVIDKPQNWTSMDVCAKLRGVFGEKRVGHGGTLDPMATGVLPVFVGRATRAVEFAETGEKAYLALLQLGRITNTQDAWGETVETRPVPADAGERLKALLPRFTGEIEQIPPMYSAVKIKGKKLYELARKGVEVERKPRTAAIHSLEVMEGGRVKPDAPGAPWPDAPNAFFLQVRCSRGTYIRTLCHDMGQALGCGGCMAGLRRTESCGFPLSDAHSLDEVAGHPDPASLLLPVDRLFADREALAVTDREARRIRHGGAVERKGLAGGEYRVYAPGGEFLMLGRGEKGRLVSVKNFFEV